MSKITTDADFEKFKMLAREYFDMNKGLTFKQFCEGLKDMDGVDA